MDVHRPSLLHKSFHQYWSSCPCIGGPKSTCLARSFHWRTFDYLRPRECHPWTNLSVCSHSFSKPAHLGRTWRRPPTYLYRLRQWRGTWSTRFREVYRNAIGRCKWTCFRIRPSRSPPSSHLWISLRKFVLTFDQWLAASLNQNDPSWHLRCQDFQVYWSLSADLDPQACLHWRLLQIQAMSFLPDFS